MMKDHPVLAAHAPDTLEIVAFTIGGHRVGIEARQVRATRRAVAGESGYPSIESLVGMPPHCGQDIARQLLVFKNQGADIALDVAAPAQLKNLELAAICPLPPLIAARHRFHGLRALALEADGVRLLLDIQPLLSQWNST